MKKILTAVAAGLLIAASLCGCGKKDAADNSVEDLKARGVFVLGLDDSFPPLGFRSETQEIVGYDIDLAKEVAKRLGVEFKAQPISWEAKEQELATGNIDCIWNGLTITEERLAALSFTEPYLSNKQVLVVRNDSNYKTLADLAGKKIALQAGSSAEDAVNANEAFKSSLAEIVPLQENLTALQDLKVKGVDGVVMDSVVAEYSIKVSNLPFHVMEESLAAENYGIAFRKNDVKLTAEVQKILKEMVADGTVAEISTKWFGSDISVIKAN
ncbi:MAG: amino acid ABC transporter substrate-binding protein [Treponema sp.]|nr:amino acid ABC transporter substrate-binding protein [Treponema sp.]